MQEIESSPSLVTLSTYKTLALRDTVLFPRVIAPFFVGRDRSIKAVRQAFESDRNLLLLTEKDGVSDANNKEDFYSAGTQAQILQMIQLPDETLKVLIQGVHRVRVESLCEQEGILVAQGAIQEDIVDEKAIEPLRRAVLKEFEDYLKLNQKNQHDIVSALGSLKDMSKLADTLAFHLPLRTDLKQALLETPSVFERFEKLLESLESEIDILSVEQKIRNRIKKQVEKSQKEYYLNEQLKAIQKELDGESSQDDLKDLADSLAKAPLPKEAREKAQSELKKLKHMSPMSSEASLIRGYLDWILALPWKHGTKTRRSLSMAQKILDKDHYGLDKVKERILEFLAVYTRTQVGSILCLVGPPGVGKTSLVKSIAKAMGRKFARISLGGVRDEAEIRGHRRTYVGSMPGKILQSLKKVQCSNPVILLDEIDKMGMDWRGDPASALLEVLDPEQNSAFSDHYLELDYDLSQVVFVATANTLDIPHALRDRLEILRLSGYTSEEKMHIAQDYLVPRQRKKHGLTNSEFSVETQALQDLLEYYCREAGVRQLEREIAKLARKTVRALDDKSVKKLKITSDNLASYAGVKRFESLTASQEDSVGMTTGLAWTEAGGELLCIEVVIFPGKGKVTATGKLGEVMQESVQAAASFIRSRSDDYHVPEKFFEEHDFHVHVPEGATPKDGPSAGVAICTSLMSVITGRPVRSSVAMTGEISLRGRVMTIGGLKEKVLAAHQRGIAHVLIPQGNVKDLEELPDDVKKSLKITPVSKVDEVFAQALCP